MGLSVGIVGLPNVGKSTLFNALLKKQQALAANYPFATIEPNTGIVQVPDERLEKLAEVVASERDSIASLQNDRKMPPLVPATITFTDIAGLVAGAASGEGLGNQFLANIRETDLICHVLRAFEDGDVVLTGEMDPVEDLKTVRMELRMKDIETVEKNQNSKIKTQDIKEKIKIEKALQTVLNLLEKDESICEDEFDEWEWDTVVKPLHLLSTKPEIFVVNVGEDQVQSSKFKVQNYAEKLGVEVKDVVVVSAKIESELSTLAEDEQAEFLDDLGMSESGLERMARAAYEKLNLISFLTAGEIECRAWTIKKDTRAPQAAGVIHTDFENKFIKADVIGWQDFVSLGGWKQAREVGKVRMEGREYRVRDGDVIEFRIGS